MLSFADRRSRLGRRSAAATIPASTNVDLARQVRLREKRSTTQGICRASVSKGVRRSASDSGVSTTSKGGRSAKSERKRNGPSAHPAGFG